MMLKVILEIFFLFPPENRDKDVNINEAMTRQITLDKSENRTIHGLVC